MSPRHPVRLRHIQNKTSLNKKKYRCIVGFHYVDGIIKTLLAATVGRKTVPFNQPVMLNPSIWKLKRDLKKTWRHNRCSPFGIRRLWFQPGVIMFGYSQTFCRAMSFSRCLGQKGKAWKQRTVLDISQQTILYFIPHGDYNAAWKHSLTKASCLHL